MESSVLLVAGQDPSRGRFGTGFVVRTAAGDFYVVTCAHVLKEIGESVRFFGEADPEPRLVAESGVELCDISILSSPLLNRLTPLTLLDLSDEAAMNGRCHLIGFEDRGEGRLRLQRSIKGTLRGAAKLVGGPQFRVLEFTLDSPDALPQGFSGGPLISDDTGSVVGVVLERRSVGGDKHLAAAVSSLSVFWPDAPIVRIPRTAAANRSAGPGPVIGPLGSMSSNRVTRETEEKVLRRILAGITPVVVAPPLSGKTTFLLWAAAELMSRGWATVYLDLELLPELAIRKEGAFIDALGRLLSKRVAEQTGTEAPRSVGVRTVDEFHSLASNALSALGRQCLVAFDMNDGLIASPGGRTLLRIIRTADNRRAWDANWSGRHFVTACSLKPASWEQAPQSPFGLETWDLPDFTLKEFSELAKCRGATEPISEEQCRQSFEATGGHPFLAQASLDELAKQRTTAEWTQSALRGEGAAGQHLHQALSGTGASRHLITKLTEVADGKPDRLSPDEASIAMRRGLVKREGKRYILRCPLYGEFLRWQADR